MEIIVPEEVTESKLTVSNVPLTDYTEWDENYNGGAGYAEGDTVRKNFIAYESAADSNTDDPEVGVDADPKTWIYLGYVNRWRMFTEGSDSVTSQDDTIETTLVMESLISSVALLNCRGATANVVMTDSADGEVYNETKDLIAYEVNNWWDFYFAPYDEREDVVFEDLPPYIGADIDITISGNAPTDTVQCGRVVLGPVADLGVAVYGTNVSRLDYSTKDRDGFGNLRIVKRRSVRVVDYRIWFPENQFDFIDRKLKQVASTPCVAIGEVEFESTIVFGIYQDFRLDFADYGNSQGTIEFEGI